ncbi:MAG: tetratricopeptide repeat protein [Cyanobacteria bacterium SBLK]|nr:tetratricopeptide repeat protein [Cyanobacteria bacterium SBLK]
MTVQLNDPFTEVFACYQKAIAELSGVKSPQLPQILAVLLARDEVEALQEDDLDLTGDLLAELVALDHRLQDLAGAIASHPQIEQCRQTRKPPESSWWWFLEVPPSPPPKIAHFDWLWSLITVTCLVGAGTYATNTVKAFSHESLSLLKTFSTISQGAGLVLVTSGTLTNQGQKVVRDTLVKIGIRDEYETVATCGLAFLLFAVTYGINTSIPNFGKYFYLQGLKNYENGYLDRAETDFERAQSLSPNNVEIELALGDVYETFSKHKKAYKLYENGIKSGHPYAFNGAGRSQMRMAKTVEELVKAESIFRLGLAQPTVQNKLKYFIYGHLGFTLILQVELGNFSEQEIQMLYLRAEDALQNAIALENEVDETLAGWGMNYCYLGILYDRQAKIPPSQVAWKNCQEKAKPTSKDQYQDIVIYGQPEVAEKIDVTKIVQVSPSNFLETEESIQSQPKN